MTITWLILIAVGIGGYLLVYDVIKPGGKDEEKNKLWHEKFDKLVKIFAPIVIICGLLLILMEIYD